MPVTTKKKKISNPAGNVLEAKITRQPTMAEVIQAKRTALLLAGVELKKHFVGIDHVIDKVLADIEAWYCMPHVLSRPVIVCLWGLTGTGKTDLVRKLVQLLDLADSFLEIQMCNSGGSNVWSKDLESVLQGSNISQDKPGILLLDEIQRFRSVDENGHEIHDYSFQDLWMLLSDGTFGGVSDNKRKIMETIMEMSFQDEHNPKQAKQEAKEERRWFYSVYREACDVKKLLCREESVEELMTWTREQRLQAYKEGLEKKTAYKPKIYSKLLIFICGNLDEAYMMANSVSSDISADVFHENSLSINTIHIKDALKRRFKPEQIARFGNAHIIYPALSEAAYREIIARRSEDVRQRFINASNIDIQFDKSILDAIFRNGVFPTQGTRPVFSTISAMLETSLPYFLMQAELVNQDRVSLRYEDKHTKAMIGGRDHAIKNEGDIDKIKEAVCEDHITAVAVHELGHALVLSVLTGEIPKYIDANANNRGGLVMMNQNAFVSKKSMIAQVAVGWGGIEAEKLVFGEENIGTGSTDDIQHLTSYAANAIRSHSFGSKSGKIFHELSDGADNGISIAGQTNAEIQRLISRQRKVAQNILRKHKKAFVALVAACVKAKGKLAISEYVRIARKQGIKVHYPKYLDYTDMFKAFSIKK